MRWLIHAIIILVGFLLFKMPAVAAGDCPRTTGLSKTQNLIPGEKIKLLGSGLKTQCNETCIPPGGNPQTCVYTLFIHMRNNDPALFPNIPQWNPEITAIEDTAITFIVPPAPAGNTYDIALNGKSQFAFAGSFHK